MLRNRRIVTLIDDNSYKYWWLAGGISVHECVGAWYPAGSSNKAGSFINLNSPGLYTLTEGAAMNWGAYGWVSGVTSYLKTGISVDGGNFSVLCRFTDASTSAARIFGTAVGADGSPRCFIVPYLVGNKVYYCNGTGDANKSPGFGVGAFATLGIAGNKAYRNGIDEGLTLPAWTGSNTNELYIWGQNNGGTPANRQGRGYCKAFAVYRSVLTADQMLAVSIRMNALFPSE